MKLIIVSTTKNTKFSKIMVISKEQNQENDKNIKIKGLFFK